MAKKRAEAKPATVPGKPYAPRATYFLPPELIDKVRDVAWWDRETVNGVVQAALEEHIARREKERGEAYTKRTGALRRGRAL